jgi:hypothetical protein
MEDGDLDESKHNASSIMDGSLHGKEYKAPSMRGSFLNKTQKLVDKGLFKAVRNTVIVDDASRIIEGGF